MVTDCGVAPGQAPRSGRPCGGQPPFRRGHSFHRAGGVSLAEFAKGVRQMEFGICSFFTLGQPRCVGTHCRGAPRGSRSGRVLQLCRHCSRSPRLNGLNKKEVGDSAIGRSRSRLTARIRPVGSLTAGHRPRSSPSMPKRLIRIPGSTASIATLLGRHSCSIAALPILRRLP